MLLWRSAMCNSKCDKVWEGWQSVRWKSSAIMTVVIVYSVSPKNVPPGHYSPVNNVPPQWILSPLEQSWELSPAGIQALVGEKTSSFWVIWSSHTGLRAMEPCVRCSWQAQFMHSGVEWFTHKVPPRFACSAKTGKEAWKVSFRALNDKHKSRRPGYEAKCG